jgi:hypothetical protein
LGKFTKGGHGSEFLMDYIGTKIFGYLQETC